MGKRSTAWGLAVGLSGAMTVAALAADQPGVRHGTSKPDTRPAIWQQAAGKDVLAALEVARQDAIRKLMGRIYGLRVEANVEVIDLVAPFQSAREALAGEIHGFKEVDTIYFDDGSCQLKLQVTLRDTIEAVRKCYRRVEENARLVSEENLENIETRNEDKTITVLGSGALRGSPGVRVIQAQRAAEVRALERIAARLFGIRVNAQTHVKDFVLASDRVQSMVAACLKGVRFTDVEVTDQFVAVTGQLVLKTTIERIERTYRRFVQNATLNVEDLTKVSTREELKTITEIGKATYRDLAAEPVRGQWVSEEKVVERVLKTEIKVED